MAKKNKLNTQETKKLLPFFKKFNGIARLFIKNLNKQIEIEENKINTISVVVKGGKLPTGNSHNISIQTIDINNTKVRTKDSGTFTQKMDWESDFRQQKKGKII